MFSVYKHNVNMEGACSKGEGQRSDRNLGNMAEDDGPVFKRVDVCQ